MHYPLIVDAFFRQAARLGSAHCCYSQRAGQWEPTSWGEAAEYVVSLASALLDAGCKKGDRVALFAETSQTWLLVDLAAQAAGCVLVGIYPTLLPDQVGHILAHSESRMLFVDRASALASIDDVLAECDALQEVICFEQEGRSSHTASRSLDQLVAAGRALSSDPSELPYHQLEADDWAALIYTSGTTGTPKGAILTHGNISTISHQGAEVEGMNEQDRALVFLPLAHVLQRIAAYGGLTGGVVSYFPPSLEALPEAFSSVQPTIFACVPRIFEKVRTKIDQKLMAASPVKRGMFKLAYAVGQAHSRYQRKGRGGRFWALANRLADRVVFEKMRANTFGNSLRAIITGGAPPDPELLEFFHACGILILDGYGLTETAAPITLSTPTAYRFGTAGKPLPGSEVKIAEDGEVLLKGPGVFIGYYKDEAATRAVFDEQGWFHSGDLGKLDSEGYLTITGRKKELIVTAGGKNIAPTHIEHLLTGHPLVEHAVVIGDRRPYLVALLSLEAETLAAWAQEHGLTDTGQALLASSELKAELAAHVDSCNAELPRYESIKRYEVMAAGISQDNGLLTPTLKIKRHLVADHFAAEIDGLYR